MQYSKFGSRLCVEFMYIQVTANSQQNHSLLFRLLKDSLEFGLQDSYQLALDLEKAMEGGDKSVDIPDILRRYFVYLRVVFDEFRCKQSNMRKLPRKLLRFISI